MHIIVDGSHTSSFLAYEAVFVITLSIVKFAVLIVIEHGDTTRVFVRSVCLPSAKSRHTSVEPVLEIVRRIYARRQVLVKTNPTARTSTHQNDQCLLLFISTILESFGLREIRISL